MWGSGPIGHQDNVDLTTPGVCRCVLGQIGIFGAKPVCRCVFGTNRDIWREAGALVHIGVDTSATFFRSSPPSGPDRRPSLVRSSPRDLHNPCTCSLLSEPPSEQLPEPGQVRYRAEESVQTRQISATIDDHTSVRAGSSAPLLFGRSEGGCRQYRERGSTGLG